MEYVNNHETHEENIQLELQVLRDEIRTKIMPGLFVMSLVTVPVLFIIWFFNQDYMQILGIASAAGVLLLSTSIYMLFDWLNREQAGVNAFLSIALLAALALPFNLSGLMVAFTLCLVSLVLLGYILLNSTWANIGAVICGIVFVYVFFVVQRWDYEAFFGTLLADDLSLLLSAVMNLTLLVITFVILRVIVLSQDAMYRQSRMAEQEARQQAEMVKEQQVELQATNTEINERIAMEASQRKLLQEMITQIQLATQTLNYSTAQIQSTISQQVASATEQDAAVVETSITLNQMRQAIAQTAEKAQSIAQVSAQSVKVSQLGLDAVNDSINGMQMLQERVDNIAETILALAEQTQQIGEIIETVNGLAQQSKLLALNASIEAARAGVEGKGFSVVAMEVRQLAEQSHEATNRVRSILSEIQHVTESAVMVTEAGSKGAASGQELAAKAGDAIRELSVTITTAAQSTQQIVASTQQQSNGMDQVVSAMQQIREVSAQTKESIRQTEDSMHDLKDMTTQLTEIVTQQPV